ncbi:YbgA family protein [Streptosporangium sp. G11]|uniref:YbgA family protein n=1 Tax=Streptosporangium sp. G11 TaxID=3436926 RepID=UPI003EBCC157
MNGTSRTTGTNGTDRTDGQAVRPRVAVSGCLMGEPVRFDGGHCRDRFLNGELDRHVEWVHICPEMEIGLGSPRETLRLERSPDGTRLVSRKSRVDLTDRMTALAGERGPALREVDGYVFKSRSPSCGVHGIPVHEGGTTVDRKGRGVFAGAVLDTHPLLPVEDEGRLNDALLRESFVERIFARARLRALLESDWRPRDLVSFHARHKMQLLAHDPEASREAGRVVAGAGTRPRDELAADYARVFGTAFATKVSIGRHVNVLQHCMGMVGDALDPERRADLTEVIASYRAGQVALSVPATLIRHHARGLAGEYVRHQTYFSPYPEDLRLRNHVPA